MNVFIFFLLFFLASPGSVSATHEADHRYTVSGYVRDAAGTPLSGLNITLEHKGGEKKIRVTDRRGYYEVLFHLHDDNAGDEVIVAVGNETKKLTVAFDPEDRFTDRRGQVDFGAPGKDSENSWIYWTGGMLFVGAVIYLGFFRKKKKGTHKKDQARKKKR